MTLEEVRLLDAEHYMPVFGERLNVLFTHGEGCLLYDEQGKTYWDFMAGIAVNALGYNHPKLTGAIIAQTEKYLHIGNFFYNEPQARLAQLLTQCSPFERVFFANSGAEANEGAIKLARKFFYAEGMDKTDFICMHGAFHGRTIATLAATGQEKYEKPYRPLVPGFTHVPYNDIEAVQNAVTDKTCAVMLEAVQGESGVIPADAAFMQAVRKLCDDNGLLLILDEVQTGMGRTGTLFAFEHFGIVPDIVTLAKGLGGGVPIGAVLARDAVCAFSPGDHGTTFGGNPLACAAACAVVLELTQTPLLEQAANTGVQLKEMLEQIAKMHPGKAVDVRGRGLMLGMQLDESIPARDVQIYLLEQGFIIGTAGRNTLRFVPPLIMPLEGINELCVALDGVLSQAQ